MFLEWLSSFAELFALIWIAAILRDIRRQLVRLRQQQEGSRE